jgi:hypothetical protein
VGDESVMSEFAGVWASGYGNGCSEIDSGIVGEMGDTEALATGGGYVSDVQAAIIRFSQSRGVVEVIDVDGGQDGMWLRDG